MDGPIFPGQGLGGGKAGYNEVMAAFAHIETMSCRWRPGSWPACSLPCDCIRHALARVAEETLDSEYRLITRCLNGEEVAWEELVKTYTRRVYSLCYRFTGSDAQAQDLTQEVFLRVFRALGNYRAGEGAFATWIMTLTRNLLIDHYRRTKQDRITDTIDKEGAELYRQEAPATRPDGLISGREASEILQAALQRLSPELRETVILRDLEEMEYREIAQVLKVPEGTVKSRLNRGRAELARILRKQKALL